MLVKFRSEISTLLRNNAEKISWDTFCRTLYSSVVVRGMGSCSNLCLCAIARIDPVRCSYVPALSAEEK